MKRSLSPILLMAGAVLLPASALSQTSSVTPAPVTAASPPTASQPGDASSLLDQLGGLVDRGRLDVEIGLQAGRVSAAPAWTVEVAGTPRVAMRAEAAEGRVRRLDVALANGTLLVAGKGLRPKVYVESFTFEEGRGISQARFHGKGIWKPIVGIFRGVAMSALRKLELRTDIPSVLKGDFLASTTPPQKSAEGKPPPAGPSFLDLVTVVRVKESELVAFPDRPLELGAAARFRTASGADARGPVRLVIDSASFQPARGGAPAKIEVAGRLDGEIEKGEVAFVGSRSAFSRGELRGGVFRVRSAESGALQTELEAASLSVDLTSGEFHLPGGPQVAVDPPSRFAIRRLRVRSDGSYSGVLDAELSGKVGRVVRAGTALSASDVHLRTQGMRVEEGRATGDVDLEFDYRVNYPLVIHYPVKELAERRVPLLFRGPFRTRLHFENAGAGGEGTVTGDYAFRVPWSPVEQAALEVLRAKWSQDVAAVVRKVDFTIDPRKFAPCGGGCFVMNLEVIAEKKSSKRRFFRQVCEPEGRANLVVDAPTRSFQLRNVKIEPKCKGVVGWFVNFLSPFLTKSYTDVTIFQMPEDIPFTIESVGSGPDFLAIGGRVAWKGEGN